MYLKLSVPKFCKFCLLFIFVFSNASSLLSQRDKTSKLKGDVLSIVEKTTIQGMVSITKSHFDTKGNLLWLNEYDDSEKRINISRFQTFPNDSIIQFVYNYDGDITQTITIFHLNDSTSIFHFVDDINDIRDTTIYHNRNELTRFGTSGKIKVSRKFDDKGNIIESIRRDQDGKIVSNVSNSYSDFDSLGNWRIKETSLKRGSSSLPITVERKINYFDRLPLNDIVQVHTLALKYDESIEDFFTDTDRVKFNSLRLFDSKYYYQITSPEATQHRKIFDLNFEAKIIDLRSNCNFRPDNYSEGWKESCVFIDRLKYHLDSGSYKLEPTGNHTIINDIKCEEFKLTFKNGIVEHYYIDTTKPFVNYGEFHVVFPGFVIKSKRKSFRGFYEWTVEVKDAEFPGELLDIYDSFHNQ